MDIYLHLSAVRSPEDERKKAGFLHAWIVEHGIKQTLIHATTLQSLMNTKLSQHRFWPCHENGLIKTIQTQTIPRNQCVSFKSASHTLN